MTREAIQRDFEVFVHDGDKAVGAVRDVGPHGRPEIVVYVENAGDFVGGYPAVPIRQWHRQTIGLMRLLNRKDT